MDLRLESKVRPHGAYFAYMYRVPARLHEHEITVDSSRFVTTVAHTRTVEAARELIAAIAADRPDATHHVYAFAVGHGASVTHGMSDAGEPSGTAGPPTLAVLKGSDLGDVTVVTSRYFGGRKLGTGGLVRAYTEAAQTALATLPTVVWVERTRVAFEIDYRLYESVVRCLAELEAVTVDTDFADTVRLQVDVAQDRLEALAQRLAQLSAGRVELISESSATED